MLVSSRSRTSGFAQVKHEVVGSQTGDVDAGVETLERIVEIVGQKDRLQLARSQHLSRPVRLAHSSAAVIVESFPVV